MPVDYSKWDNLELSDDSDIEVHPNVDKRSFIRAKQNQIHLERQQRRHHIETLKYERQVNDGLAKRIASLLAVLRAHADEARQSTAKAGEVAFRAVMESAAAGAGDDQPPTPPAGVHQNAEQPQSYTKMMAALLDQVNKAIEARKPAPEGAARYEAMVAEIEEHQAKVADLQAQLLTKLAELEREEGRKITSDSIHTGFDSSFVNTKSGGSGGGGGSSGGHGGGQPELLNPNYDSATRTMKKPADAGKDGSGDDADNDDEDDEPTDVARAFAKIPAGNHRDSRDFIMKHPELVLKERNEESILVLAFDAELEGQPDTARQCVHQAKLLEYCRSLGRDGVALFFQRIQTRDHKAHDLFYGDVRDTYQKIRTRVAEIKAQQRAGGDDSAGSGEGVEQIQLHAVEPGTVITIRVPPPVAEGDDSNADDAEERRAARAIFEGFTPAMRTALESGSLDRVNEVLGRLPVDEAEALVAKFGEAGILSLEDEIIDATTEQGRAQLRELGRDDRVDEHGVEKKDKGNADEPAAAAAPPAQPEEEYPDPE